MARQEIEPGSWGTIGVAPEVRGGAETGRWVARVEVRYRGGARKALRRYRKTASSAERAVQLAAREEAEKWGPGGEAPSIGEISEDSAVPELVRVYLDQNRAQWKPKTLKAYDAVLRRYVSPHLAELKIREVTTRSANALFRGLTGPGAWHSTRAVLSGAWRWAISEELIGDRDPIRNSKRPPTRKPRKEVVTMEGFRMFRDAAYLRCYPAPGSAPGPYVRTPWLPFMLTVSLGTGVRVGELVQMRWEHLHRVDAAGVRVEGVAWDDASAGRLAIEVQGLKGRKGRGEGENDALPRRLALPRFAEDALRAWKIVQPDELGGWVWPTAGGRPVDSAHVARAWNLVLRDVEDQGQDLEGVPVRNHMLRASAVTWIANDPRGGHDLAARFAGHRQSSVTQQYYILPQLVDAAEILQRKWDAGTKQI